MAGLSNTYPVYAPLSDLTLFLGAEPADGEALLERASGVIREVTKTAFYGTELDGFTPTAESVRNAFHDAAVLQAAAYVRAEIGADETLATGAQTPTIQSKSLGGRSVTYGTNSSAVQAREALLGGAMSPEALSVLSAAGLLRSSVSTGGRVNLPRLFPHTPGLSGGSAYTE